MSSRAAVSIEKRADTTATRIEKRVLDRSAIPEIAIPLGLVVPEATTNKVSFNVMPERNVEETLLVKEYRLFPRYIEAVFDRKYVSSMERSPSHLIFLTALVHMQKLMYTYLCHEFRVPYDPYGREQMKIWPTVVNVDMAAMILREDGIKHRVWFRDVERTGRNKFKVRILSKVEDKVSINGEALVFLI